MSEYDAIVLGAGAPGEHCAAALAKGGARVAMVERELLGGECSYWARIPSKTLPPGEALAEVRDAPGAREAVTGSLDLAATLGWRDFMVSSYNDSGNKAWADGAGIAVLRSYDTQPGFLSLVSDGHVRTGAYAVGPEAGEWLQQATLAIRAKVPLDVIQPFPTFSEAVLQALRDIDEQLLRHGEEPVARP